jgi:hypothetical protein
MTECIPQFELAFHPGQRIVVRMDAPDSSSDGGALLLRQIDEELGLTAGLARWLEDRRDPHRVVHRRIEQVRQRVFQIALGYEDANDADRLRHDPVLTTVCDRSPDDPQGLSSQPTLSRLENSVSRWGLARLVRWFERDCVRSLPADTEVVVLDIDSTDDPTHGQQELSCFHGYFDQHMYHPLLVFDGDTGQLVTMMLRAGSAHASRGARRMLRRLIRRIKRRFPAAAIVVRGDSHFAMPRILEELERCDRQLGSVDYLLGLAKNPVLVRWAQPTLEQARELSERQNRSVQRFASGRYAAESWDRQRRVILRAEHSAYWGANPRFLITSLEEFDPETLYRAYCQRGDCENRIKDLKNALAADRLSCSRFNANAFRLLLHAVAYRLLHALRQRLGDLGSPLARCQFDTLRLRLLKVAAVVQRSVRRITVRLPRSFSQAQLFRQLALYGTGPPS